MEQLDDLPIADTDTEADTAAEADASAPAPAPVADSGDVSVNRGHIPGVSDPAGGVILRGRVTISE